MNQTVQNVVEQAAIPVGSVRPPVAAAPVQEKHHWSIYLVVASGCLLIAGLASDPNVVETVRSILALR